MLSALRATRAAALPASFHPVLAAVAVSSVGDGVRLIAFPLLAARLTDDARQVALVAVAGQIPWLVTGFASGILADRFDRRRILCVVDGLRAIAMGLLAVLTALDALSVPALAASGFLLGCGQTFFNGAWVGLVPELVDRSQLVRANARIQATAMLAGLLLGTPLGAVLYGVSAPLPLAVDALSFACSSVCIFSVPRARLDGREQAAGEPARRGVPGAAGTVRRRGALPQPADRRDRARHRGVDGKGGPGKEDLAGPAAGDGRRASRAALGLGRGRHRRRQQLEGRALDGVRWLRRDRLLLSLCLVSATTNFVVAGLMSVLVLYARQALGVGTTGFALLVVAFGAGGLGGVSVAPRLASALGSMRTLRAGPPIIGAIILGLGAAKSGFAAAALVAAYGAANTVWNSTVISLRQSVVPDALLSRVSMVYQMTTTTAGAVGTPIAALLFDGVGPRAPFVAGGVLLAFSTFLVRRSAHRIPVPSLITDSR
ncbi:MFS transporter [Streptomyces sp. NPDC007095]|jgi:MFS family permease|uniref:MFS transporter n=1 Tax=Streptomyces sp. NPDC007095 TaxID=3154482 RepID=UPI000C70D72B